MKFQEHKKEKIILIIPTFSFKKIFLWQWSVYTIQSWVGILFIKIISFCSGHQDHRRIVLYVYAPGRIVYLLLSIPVACRYECMKLYRLGY